MPNPDVPNAEAAAPDLSEVMLPYGPFARDRTARTLRARDLDLVQAALSPVREAGERAPDAGIARCLSGGYHALVFHLGMLWHLNEFGYLSRLDRISSVSGGSITAAMRGLKWSRLRFSNGIAQRLVDEVIDPIRAFAHETIDVGSVVKGIFLPGSISDKVAKVYREYLLGEATPQDLRRGLFVASAFSYQPQVRNKPVPFQQLPALPHHATSPES